VHKNAEAVKRSGSAPARKRLASGFIRRKNAAQTGPCFKSGPLGGEMSARLLRTLLATVPVILVSSWALRAVGADPAAKGEEWETTNQMSMDGLPIQMPVQSMKICASKDRTEPPGAQREHCQNSNFKRVGDKVTWDVTCSNPAMTGTGEIVYAGANSYSGTIKFLASEGNMTIKLTGRKLGDCDHPL
jgi:hypothetical protein